MNLAKTLFVWLESQRLRLLGARTVFHLRMHSICISELVHESPLPRFGA